MIQNIEKLLLTTQMKRTKAIAALSATLIATVAISTPASADDSKFINGGAFDF